MKFRIIKTWGAQFVLLAIHSEFVFGARLVNSTCLTKPIIKWSVYQKNFPFDSISFLINGDL